LLHYEILDTDPEPEFDDITLLTAFHKKATDEDSLPLAILGIF
jgi:hypothetical protein